MADPWSTIGYLLSYWKSPQRTAFLCFLDKLFFTFWAGDGDFSLPPGYTDGLTAAGAIKISVFPVLYFFQKPQIFSVFLIALIGIAGKCPEDRPPHTKIRKQHQRQLQKRAGKQDLQYAGNQTGKQNRCIQFICAVAPLHKLPDCGSYLKTKLAQPVSKPVHRIPLYISLSLLYGKKAGFQYQKQIIYGLFIPLVKYK